MIYILIHNNNFNNYYFLITSHIVPKKTKKKVSMEEYWLSHALSIFLHIFFPIHPETSKVNGTTCIKSSLYSTDRGTPFSLALIHVLIRGPTIIYSNYLFTGLSSLSLILLAHWRSPSFSDKENEPACNELAGLSMWTAFSQPQT